MRALLTLVNRTLWPPAEPESLHRRWLLVPARYLYALGRDLATGEITLRAMSLVYTTMLATVPVLGIAVAVARALGYHEQFRPVLLRALEPIGAEDAAAITERIIGFAGEIPGGLLSLLSLLLLLATVLSMAQKVERSFNFVWRVDHPRSLGRRFSEYLSVVLLGPTIMLAAMATIASLESTLLDTGVERSLPALGALIDVFGRSLPYLLIVAAFTFLYLFVPNTRVRFRPALIGGLAGGISWVGSGFLFTSLVASSARIESIYSGFAIVLILMVWIYISWLVLLLGSLFAYYLQNPFNLRYGQRTDPIGNEARERLCLAVMYLIASDYARPGHGWTRDSLAASLQIPRDALEPILNGLSHAGLMQRASGERLVPGRDPHRITLTEILATVRGREPRTMGANAAFGAGVNALADRINAGIAAELGERTLGELVDTGLNAA